jgi:hypothetical protein
MTKLRKMNKRINSIRLSLFIGAITLTSSYACLGQKVIPVTDKMLRDSIGENATRNGKQAGKLTLIRRMTKNTKKDVAATQRLQYDYRNFLKQTGSTASLKVSDARTEQQAVTQASSATDQLGAYSFATNLNQVYRAQQVPMEKSQALYDQLAPYDETLVFTDLSSFTTSRHARQVDVTALEEMSQRRKLQLAATYQQFAEQRIAKAGELRRLLASDERFSMTEAERLETLHRMQDYLLSSQQLKTKADALMQQASRPPFQKNQALNAFRQAQERKVLASTPLFQD